jgi:hypothetical protein
MFSESLVGAAYFAVFGEDVPNGPERPTFAYCGEDFF